MKEEGERRRGAYYTRVPKETPDRGSRLLPRPQRKDRISRYRGNSSNSEEHKARKQKTVVVPLSQNVGRVALTLPLYLEKETRYAPEQASIHRCLAQVKGGKKGI